MLFISSDFMEFFLPITFGVFFIFYLYFPKLCPLSLLISSVVFCAVNGIQQSFILASSILINFSTVYHLLNIPATSSLKRRMLLIIGISINLLILIYFKYIGFIISNISFFFQKNIIFLQPQLPIGISFYTFTQIAFLVDVYRNYGPGKLSITNYALFVTYFPHVIAGPIIHWREMMPQFDTIRQKRQLQWFMPKYTEQIIRGLTLFGIGLSKKILIADILSSYVEKGYSHANDLSLNDAWLTSLSYTFQLYYDFSGYSDMAIGISLFFGIVLPINFNSPYRSTSIQDFWRRWHMTLSRWLRDYVFIPLGGSHGTSSKTLRNLFLTFLIGGVWHGAAWTFIIWGALHGGACCIYRLWHNSGYKMPKPLAVLTTFLFINFCWIFFRAPDLPTSINIVTAMLSTRHGSQFLPNDLWFVVILLTGLSWTLPTSQNIALEKKFGTSILAGLCTGALIVLTIFSQNTSEPSPFLYFNF
jgi:D-alanyl-lipoteichoic acid acyltransferase DltB (MBOAT superfamily)